MKSEIICQVANQHDPTGIYTVTPGGHQRRGSASILFVALLTIIVFVGAFAIDYAYMELAQTELRISTDLATRAASAQYGITQNLKKAQNRAISTAYRNMVGGRRLKLTRQDIQVGRSVAGKDGKYEFVKDLQPYNSFRIVANMTDGSRSGPLSTFFQNYHAKTFQLSTESVVTEINLDIVLVLDRSGSMAWDLSGRPWQYPDRYVPNWHPLIWNYYLRPPIPRSRWKALEVAVEAFLDEMSLKKKKERVALVSYSSNWGPYRFWGKWYSAREVQTDHSFSTNYVSIRQAFRRIGSKPVIGGTAISSGIDRARSLLKSSSQGLASEKIIILMTDGEWNVGYNPIVAAQKAATENIKIYTVSFGKNAGGPVMKAIADKTGGDFYSALTAAQLEDTFRKIARSIGLTFTH